MQFIKQILGWGFVIGLAYVLYNFAVNNNDPIDFVVSPDSTATFTGTVLINDNEDCAKENSGRCFLKIKSGDSNVFVIYDTGDRSICVNEEMSIYGKTIKTGTNLKIYGFFKQENTSKTVLICPTKDYYIKEI